MSVVKIPFILAAAMANHIALTPPQPPAATRELAKDVSTTDSFFNASVKTMAPFAKWLIWTISICESAVLLASEYPSHPLAERILGTLTWGPSGHVARMGITPSLAIGYGLAIAGGLIRWQCYRTLGRLFTYEITVRSGHRLVTEGPYSVVRHPSYAAGMVMTVGIAICLASPGSWVQESGVLTTTWGKVLAGTWSIWSTFLLAWLAIVRTTQEDQIVKKEFREQWEKWAAKVPYKLIPGIY
ncbi:hypothetical protein OBBRIDRAFT_819793 [Obba rivulosa]|uniref:Protein-S-isoprenylcysteine O-methyltransferase n=1 Tax=Obba rivulosa TaxID=1052685 RepID=A0A8E2AZ79_9APHY|nr:hypothetical protein OBBRIDRAFT_819793 [Obba rivulosa]